MILALDTSTAIASVALYDGLVSGEISWRSGRGHSVELMAQTDSLMKLRKIQPEQLIAVAVAVGPGSYTGVRVGIAAGKGLCLALGIPMVGVSTLDVLAEAQRESCWPVRPLLDAGRQRFATAIYRKVDGDFLRSSPIEGKTLKEILNEITEKTLLCGDVTAQQVDQLLARRELVEVASPASSFRRAGFLAEIGWKRYHSGKYEDPAQVDAVYLGKEVS
ncbi:MAG: tRNA (adenosine(37)-N6)-threonylcarbamoyltransferase complex dimerization subunit type 1 TsaB [Chloroflexota bacterium]